MSPGSLGLVAVVDAAHWLPGGAARGACAAPRQFLT